MSNTEWQLSGSVAERYEEHLVPVIFRPWAEHLLAVSGLGAGDRLLDLACGTGIVARVASRQGVLATGADLNDGMLAVARRLTEGREVAFEAADAQALPFDDGGFDAVICQQGLQFFPDKAAAAAECLRILRPGGVAIFCTARGIEENPLMQAQVAAFAAHLGEEAAGAIRAVCGFADQEESRALFSAAGFASVDVQKVVLPLKAPDGLAFVQGLMRATPVAERIAALDDARRAQMADDLLAGFGACFDGRALSFPHSSHVVVATKAA